MMDEFKIIEISILQAEKNRETRGIVPKIWVEDEIIGKALFKEAITDKRHSSPSRTDWSEKVVSELNKLVGLPAAEYELASLIDGQEETWGSISLDLQQAGDKERYSLETLLQAEIPNYEIFRDYTVEKVAAVLEARDVHLPPGYEVPEGIKDGVDMFVGILMIDAWIANGDRHDENIEIVEREDGTLYLSPVFDHGYSLGATAEPRERESTPIEQFDKDSNISFFQDVYEDLSGKEAFEQAIAIRPEAGQIWLEQLAKVKQSQIEEIFQKLGEERITENESEFARLILDYGQKQLLTLQEKMLSSDELAKLYEDYSQKAKGIGLSKTKAIARHGFKDELDRSQVHQMLNENDTTYQDIVDFSGEKNAKKIIVLKAQIEWALEAERESNEGKSQAIEAESSRERSPLS